MNYYAAPTICYVLPANRLETGYMQKFILNNEEVVACSSKQTRFYNPRIGACAANTFSRGFDCHNVKARRRYKGRYK